MRVDKAMKTIAESKTFRNWTYIVLILIIIGIFVFKGGDIFSGLAELIRAFNGR